MRKSWSACGGGTASARQAVSRWEQGAALPDAAKLLPCARLFSVTTDWLLDDSQGWEAQEPAPESPVSQGVWKWYLAGGIVTGAGTLGLVVMGILSAVYPAVFTEAGMGWVHVYTGLIGFLKAHSVEWLFALWAAVTLAGLWLLAQPSIRRRERTASRFSPYYAAGVAVSLYGVGQTAWYVQQGKTEDLPLLALFLGGGVGRRAPVPGAGPAAGAPPSAAGAADRPALHRRSGGGRPADGGGRFRPGGAGLPCGAVFPLCRCHDRASSWQAEAVRSHGRTRPAPFR